MKALARRFAALPLLLVPILVALSCSSGSPTSTSVPDPNALLSNAAGPERYPLDIGNRWTYQHEMIVFDRIDGTWEPGLRFHSTEVDEVVGTEEVFGRTYMLTRETTTDDYQTIIWWVRSRQDRTGLYEADVALNHPPHNARGSAAYLAQSGFAERPLSNSRNSISRYPKALRSAALREAYLGMEKKRGIVEAALRGSPRGSMAQAPAIGVEDSELVRLTYPLHTGSAWNVREEPFRLHCQVEGREILKLKTGNTPAWRVRGTMSLLSDTDVLLFWYGKDGFLRYYFRITANATDPEGNIAGQFMSEETQTLTEFTAARR